MTLTPMVRLCAALVVVFVGNPKPQPQPQRSTELMKRDLNDVHFHFDNSEHAFTGCAKLKVLHDNWFGRACAALRCARAGGRLSTQCASFTEWYQTHYIGKTGVGIELCDKQSALYNKCLKVRRLVGRSRRESRARRRASERRRNWLLSSWATCKSRNKRPPLLRHHL